MNRTKYIVTNIYTGEEFETIAVSEKDAINHIHYKLWFQQRRWTEMEDFEAESEFVLNMKAILNEAKHKENYHQYSLFEV